MSEGWAPTPIHFLIAGAFRLVSLVLGLYQPRYSRGSVLRALPAAAGAEHTSGRLRSRNPRRDERGTQVGLEPKLHVSPPRPPSRKGLGRCRWHASGGTDAAASRWRWRRKGGGGGAEDTES